MSEDLGVRTEHLRLQVDGWQVVDASESGEYAGDPERIWIGMDAVNGRWISVEDARSLMLAVFQVLENRVARGTAARSAPEPGSAF